MRCEFRFDSMASVIVRLSGLLNLEYVQCWPNTIAAGHFHVTTGIKKMNEDKFKEKKKPSLTTFRQHFNMKRNLFEKDHNRTQQVLSSQCFVCAFRTNLCDNLFLFIVLPAIHIETGSTKSGASKVKNRMFHTKEEENKRKKKTS